MKLISFVFCWVIVSLLLCVGAQNVRAKCDTIFRDKLLNELVKRKLVEDSMRLYKKRCLSFVDCANKFYDNMVEKGEFLEDARGLFNAKLFPTLDTVALLSLWAERKSPITFVLHPQNKNYSDLYVWFRWPRDLVDDVSSGYESTVAYWDILGWTHCTLYLCVSENANDISTQQRRLIKDAKKIKHGRFINTEYRNISVSVDYYVDSKNRNFAILRFICYDYDDGRTVHYLVSVLSEYTDFYVDKFISNLY